MIQFLTGLYFVLLNKFKIKIGGENINNLTRC